MITFSFCYNVFKSHLLQRRQKVSVCGKGLTMSEAGHFLWRGFLKVSLFYKARHGGHVFKLINMSCWNLVQIHRWNISTKLFENRLTSLDIHVEEFEGFVLSVDMETRNFHESKKKLKTWDRTSRRCYLGSFIPVGQVVKEEKLFETKSSSTNTGMTATLPGYKLDWISASIAK